MSFEPQSEAPTAVPSPRLAAADKQNDKGGLDSQSLKPRIEDGTSTLDRQGSLTADEKGDSELASTSTARKLALLTIFSLAEFLDTFNNSALFPAIPIISAELRFEPSETVWIVSAYQLTFAAFLLVVSISNVSFDSSLRLVYRAAGFPMFTQPNQRSSLVLLFLASPTSLVVSLIKRLPCLCFERSGELVAR